MAESAAPPRAKKVKKSDPVSCVFAEVKAKHTEKMRPILQKYCKQAGTPQSVFTSTLLKKIVNA